MLFWAADMIRVGSEKGLCWTGRYSTRWPVREAGWLWRSGEPLLSTHQEMGVSWGMASLSLTPPFATHLYAASYEAVFTSSRKPSQLVHHTLPAPSWTFLPVT